MKNTFGISDNSYSLLQQTFKRHPQVEEVILFGSRAKGNYKTGSDIDLAIKGQNCTPLLALNIKGIVNEELPIPYAVDVVDYNSLTQAELKSRIDRVGVIFYKKEA